jgi:hypothetical protein
MDRKFVRVLADVHCDWTGFNPVYRVYVNDELFAERAWRWDHVYLEELLQIEAEPGDYNLRWELVPPHLAQLSVSNMRVEHGPATFVDDTTLRIEI